MLKLQGAGFSAIAGDHPSALPGGVLSGAHADAISSAIAGDHPSALPGAFLSGAHAGAISSAIAGDHPSALPGGVLSGAHAGAGVQSIRPRGLQHFHGIHILKSIQCKTLDKKTQPKDLLHSKSWTASEAVAEREELRD